MVGRLVCFPRFFANLQHTVVSLAVRGNGSDTAARCSGSPITQLTNTRITASQLKNMESVEAAKMLQAALGAVPDYITLVKTAITVRASHR